MRDPIFYILTPAGDVEPVPSPLDGGVLAWARWFERSELQRVVARDGDDVRGIVSTVFIGIDHNFSGTGPPLLWESMVFGGPLDREQARYSSRAAAVAGHAALVARVQKASGS